MNKDLISRQDAIKEVSKYVHSVDMIIGNGTLSMAGCIDTAEEILEGLPSMELEPKWIPCSERLPKETGEYLVTKISIGWNYEDYTENDIAYWDNHKGFCKAEKVIAWMPIPKLTGGDAE